MPFTCEDQMVVMKSDNLDISIGCAANAVGSSLKAVPSFNARHVTVLNTEGGNSAPSKAEITALFAEIGRSCPRIESLRVALDITNNRHGPFIALPIAALTSFFRQGPQHLTSLKLSGAISADTDQEVEDLEAAVREKAPTSWKEVRLEFCELAPGTPSLDPLLQALSSCGSLEQVTLSGTSITHSDTCTGPSLARLVTENRNLKALTLWGGKRRLGKEDTMALMQALEGNTSLTELTLHACGLCPVLGRALARTLSLNTALERLILSVGDTCQAVGSSQPSNYVITSTLLADALKLHNRTVRLLSLDYSMEDDDPLTVGDSLDYDFYEYELIDSRVSQWRSNVQEVRKAFTEMLHKNTVLEVLWMNLDNQEDEDEDDDDDDDDSHDLLTSEMDMLLRLNRYGIRQILFEEHPEATSREWIKALESQKDDLNALYYLLSKSPSFCSPASPKGSKREAPEGLPKATKRQKTL